MNKAQLIEKICVSADISKAQAQRALDAFLNSVEEELQKGEKVSLGGFGTFSVRKSAARNGRNPQTGDTIAIAAKNVPVFKAFSALKDAVN